MPGVLTIDDSSPVPVNPTGFDGRGREARDYASEPFGSAPGSKGKFPDSMRIPVKDMKDLIRERRENEIGGRFIRTKAGVGCLDQNGTNYCWINGPVQAMKIARAAAGLENVSLSPASGGAQIKNYRNNGGWGSQAFSFIYEHGIAPAGLWPANHWQSNKYKTPECVAEMQKYRIGEYYEFEPRDIEAVWSSLLLNFFGAAGLNWWGHEVCYVDLAWDESSDRPMVDADNSWGEGYGNKGQFYLKGSKAVPDDYCCVRAVTVI